MIMPEGITQIKIAACDLYIAALLKCALSVSRPVKIAVYSYDAVAAVLGTFFIKLFVSDDIIHLFYSTPKTL